MNQSVTAYDVIIVGASAGGCTAAILFARQGFRVALLERHRDINAYKKVCTHYLQPNAVPTLQRLGVADDIETAGGIRNGGQAWTRWGWLGAGARKDGKSYGYSIRREVLDPILRRQAAATPGVDFRPGTTLRELVYVNNRIAGIRAEGPDRQQLELRAQLVVGADGRNSRTAELAGMPSQIKTNNRFMYFAYFRNLTLATGQRNQVWYLEPEVAYALPNDDGLTLLACALPKSKLAEFKQDVPGNFVRFFERLPNGPNLRAAEQVSEVLGMLDIPLISRRPTAPGLALVGDAAVAPDPVWGQGIGWAIQAAEWLVEATAGALAEAHPEKLDRALKRYRQQQQAAFGGRFVRDADFAQVRPFNLFERLMYSAAVRDPRLGQYTGPHTTRLADFRHFPPFKAILRALWVNLTHREQPSGSLPGQRRQLPAS
ncbi:MAG: NAD(P)/FAD-dependent oxidoreductase [Anaerolineae bacterium]|nr:NAD(P)/FAD-dependent oxidoreductase [Anaerolineae bacterium]